MEVMTDVRETPCMSLCACGKSTVQTGHCVAFDPYEGQWTLIVWPVRQGNIEVYGIPNVAGCPICFVPARKECAVGPEQMPKEALDHLAKLTEQKKAQRRDAARAVNPPAVAPGEQGKADIFALPEAQEV